MSFECSGCKEKVSNSKMVGLVFGQITSATLEIKGIKTKASLTAGFSRGELGSGFLSGLGIECPKCKNTNWN